MGGMIWVACYGWPDMDGPNCTYRVSQNKGMRNGKNVCVTVPHDLHVLLVSPYVVGHLTDVGGYFAK